MHDAIAQQWLYAGEFESLEDLRRLSRLSADRLAEDATGGLGLHELRCFDRGELADAFLRLKSEQT